MNNFCFFTITVITSCILLSVVTTALHDDLTRENYVAIFRNFTKPRIYPKNSQVHFLIDDGAYIEQWLKDSNFKIENAIEKFMANLAWREAQKIDTIHLENWDYFQSEYPQFVNWSNETCDITGEVWTTSWNMRRAILSGQSKRLVRWSIYLHEMAQRKLSENRLNPKFQNVSSFCKAVQIVDMSEFNILEHACVACSSTTASFGKNAREHYPKLWTTVHLVNVGPLVQRLYTTIRSGFKTNGEIKLHNMRENWLPLLEKEIRRVQRSQRFGGNIYRNF